MNPQVDSGVAWSAMAANEPGSVLLTRARPDEPGRQMLFRAPLRVIEARTAEEVRTALVAADAAVAEGLWVAGYVSYEAGFALERSLAHLCEPLPENEPLLWLGCYTDVDQCDGIVAVNTGVSKEQVGELEWPLTAEEYARRVEEIRRRIAEGETYQANLTMDVRWTTREKPTVMYERLLRAQPVPYGALLHPRRGWHVLSLSPELFFARKGRDVITRPMKGTAPVGCNADETRHLAAWLHTDEKNRAENVMIVDLLRNDLGRVCETASVQATRLFEVEQLPTVLQMTSTVQGRLREGVGYAELFRALFPSGSIVGAPKIQTMRLLHELETRPRGVYCGAIGYMSPHGKAEFSVAIRTVSLHGTSARMGVGSGITYDSEAAAEYDECRTKALFLTRSAQSDFGLIETMLLERGEYVLLKEHLERMAASAMHFGIPFDTAEVQEKLHAARQTWSGEERVRVRLVLDCAGVKWSASGLADDDSGGVALILRAERTDADDVFLRHKTTRRALYDRAFADAQKQGYADALFCNTRGEVTEGAIHNVVAQVDGRWITPALSSGLLPGVFRGHLLRQGRVNEGMLRLDDLPRAEAVFVCNSVRGLRRVARIMRDEASGTAATVWQDGGESRRPL